MRLAKIINPNALHMIDCKVGDTFEIVRSYADGRDFYYILLSHHGKEIPVKQYYCELICKEDDEQ